MVYDFIIIGGGPAGTAAAVYAARKQMKTLLITEEFGGQSLVSADIQNWIGEPSISGYDLAKKFEEHVRSFSDVVDVKMPEKVVRVEEVEGGFKVTTESGERFDGRTILLALGARRRRLGIPGEDKFDGRGVAFCSTSDAPIFKNKVVAVIGGGNAGLEAVVDLLPYASKIYLLEYGDALKGDPVTQERIRREGKVEVLLRAQAKEIHGDTTVTGLTYTDRATNAEKKLDLGGVFVEIGSVPNSETVKDLVETDKYGQVIIDSKHGTTSHEGIFAAGDITDDPYKQNNISAGDAVKATLAAYGYLQRIGRT
ncbi:FAD-dependent oxidoreductase [Candidatus Uhrbacteria bacterium]|nr:FAD-dependent oxidoreductase [Candidatus Uhrbacteria bacterium]